MLWFLSIYLKRLPWACSLLTLLSPISSSPCSLKPKWNIHIIKYVYRLEVIYGCNFFFERTKTASRTGIRENSSLTYFLRLGNTCVSALPWHLPLGSINVEQTKMFVLSWGQLEILVSKSWVKFWLLTEYRMRRRGRRDRKGLSWLGQSYSATG